jgi:hypothetical protein
MGLTGGGIPKFRLLSLKTPGMLSDRFANTI